MIKQYAAIYISVIMGTLVTVVTHSEHSHDLDSAEQNRYTKKTSKNIFQTLEKPIKSVLATTHFYDAARTRFDSWHENLFYYTVTPHHKKMFLSARILTVSLPLAGLIMIIYTTPQVSLYLWNMNYTSITATPSTITPASVISEMGKLSSFNQNCIMIGLEKGLRWIIERKLAPDVCINPVTWFTDKDNHDFINSLTSILLILLVWIYLLYKVYADAPTRWKSLGKIIIMQCLIRYALYLANLSNDLYTTPIFEQPHHYHEGPTEDVTSPMFQVSTELQESIKDISTSLKKLITITKENQKDQKKLVYALVINNDQERTTK
ncbi:MAG TPA: hypothetical protein VL201_03130 [Patescibacteria group bacterium]|jgi:hypothetical protein|nr:hypothetical protein [Patescibacteria group bacterium]